MAFYMKTNITLFFFFFCTNCIYPQNLDVNEQWESMTDYRFNNFPYACMLDGIFIKNDIGINLNDVMDSDTTEFAMKYPFLIRGIGEKNDSLWVLSNPNELDNDDYIEVKGMRCEDLVNFISKKEKVELITLDEVRRRRYPEVDTPCVYMINKFFIMKNQDLYRLDKDFIHHSEKVRSTDIDILKDFPPFTIIRIFTRTSHNQFSTRIGH